MSDKNVALKLSVNGEIKDVTFEQLALINNLDLAALVQLLIEKKIIEPEEIMDMVKKIREERYRNLDDLKK